MRHLFSTKIAIILVLAIVLAAALGVYAGVSNQSAPGILVQGLMTPVRAVGNALTRTAEKYYSYMFRYEALSAENEALQAVTDARSRYISAADANGQMKASTDLSGAMGRLMAVAESYPDLKANQNFLHLQQQLAAMEEKLANYRQFYNDTVLRYDRLLETIPTNLIAKMFHFKKEEFFKVEKSEKAKVTIRF